MTWIKEGKPVTPEEAAKIAEEEAKKEKKDEPKPK